MRSAETCACGSIMKIIVSIINDMTTYVAYVPNTTTSLNIESLATGVASFSISAAPSQ